MLWAGGIFYFIIVNNIIGLLRLHYSYLLIPSSLISVDACGGFDTLKIVGIAF